MLSHEGLNEEELRDVLQRAHEIESHRYQGHESIIKAAEESGLSRDAVTQALQERLGLLGAPPNVGELVFARGEGNKYYPAEILTPGSVVTLRFLNGEERRVPFESLRPLNLFPGEKVICPWPNWGQWNCTVISYNPQNRTVKVTDNWGSEKKFDLSQVYREAVVKPQGSASANMSALYLGLTALTGGVIGSVVTWLLMR